MNTFWPLAIAITFGPAVDGDKAGCADAGDFAVSRADALPVTLQTAGCRAEDLTQKPAEGVSDTRTVVLLSASMLAAAVRRYAIWYLFKVDVSNLLAML